MIISKERTIIAKENLIDLDRQIESAVPADVLASLPRDLALMHLLRAYEIYVHIVIPTSVDASNTAAAFQAAKLAQDAMTFAVSWIYKYCKPPMTKPLYSTNEQTHSNLYKVFLDAREYSIMWDFMCLLQKGWVTGIVANDGYIDLVPENHLIADGEVVEQIINSVDGPLVFKSTDRKTSLINSRRVITDSGARKTSSVKVDYNVPISLLQDVKLHYEQLSQYLWQLDKGWDLGSYTLADYRQFWITLLAQIHIHLTVCLHTDALDSLIMVKNKRRWIKDLSRTSGLTPIIIETILDDLIYDSYLSTKPGVKIPDVTCQPFLPLNRDLVALSNTLVLYSNPERNIWDLVSTKKNDLHSKLRNQKEQLWIDELRVKYKEHPELQLLGPFKFTVNGKPSDLDLLFVDLSQRFALACQLKWLNGPDRIKDGEYADKELQKGLKQARLALCWLNNNHSEVKAHTGISREILKELEIQAVVLSKNTTGGGRLFDSDIPIISENLMDFVLKEPLYCHIRTLYRVAKEHRYFPQRGRHFNEEDITCEFGGIRFRYLNGGMINLGTWDPAKDIDLAGL